MFNNYCQFRQTRAIAVLWWFVGGGFIMVVGSVWVLGMVAIGIVVAIGFCYTGGDGWQCVGLLGWEKRDREEE